MPRILVIADDLTGAAEIAGVATRFGIDTRLLGGLSHPPAGGECVVYNTDTRLKPYDEAIRSTRTIAEWARTAAFDWVFKKTDSALRGEPLAEINTVADVFGKPDMLFVPHNPSRGRCVVDGRYLINGIPLDQTEFAQDPLHPARSAEVIELLRARPGRPVRVVKSDAPACGGITVGEAATIDDVRTWGGRFDPAHQVAAGGADFFEAICCRLLSSESAARPSAPLHLELPVLIVIGTASQATAAARERFAAKNQLVAMPEDLFSGRADASALRRWTDDVLRTLDRNGVAMMSIGRPVDRSAGRAEQLGDSLCYGASEVIKRGRVTAVACEGGATAVGLCQWLGWGGFRVDAELSPGVVSLLPRGTPPGTRFVLKPGSYPWPTSLLTAFGL